MALNPTFLVGDLIMNVRSLGPDPPQVMGPPIFSSATPVAGGSIPLGAYFLVITAINNWGETVASGEQPVTLSGGNQSIQLSFTVPFGSVGNYRLYIGGATGQENGYVPFSTTTGTVTLTSLPTISGGTPPVRSSAWLPDTDGSFASATTMFRWMNDALKACSRATNGIQDVIGIPSTSGNRRYVTGGQWLRFDQCFYDGWELDLGNKAETFRNRNLTANIAISLMVDAQSDSTRIELYWTPSRTAGSATVNGNIQATDITIPITGVTNWLLADGFVSITDTSGNSEIVSYSAQAPNQLTGCIRGWSGTQAFAFQSGATVRELNIEINGYRMPYMYSVGQSALTLGVPPGWEPFLKDYLLGTFRKAEQETDEGNKLQESATKGLEAWAKSNKSVAGPRQCRMYGDYGLRGTIPGGLTGPIIIP